MSVRRMLVVLVLASLGTDGRAASEGSTLPQIVARHVNDTTVMVIDVSLERIDPAESFAALGELLERGGYHAADLPAGWGRADDAVTKLRTAGARRVYVVFTLAIGVGVQQPLIIVPLDEQTDVDSVISVLKMQGDAEARNASVIAKRLGKAVVAGPPHVIEAAPQFKPTPRPELGTALAEMDGRPIAIAVAFSPAVWSLLMNEMVLWAPSLRDQPIDILTEGCQWIAIGLDPPPRGNLEVTIQSRNANAAQGLERFLHEWFQISEARLTGAPTTDARKRMASAVSAALPIAEADRLHTKLDTQSLDALLRDALLPVALAPLREARARLFATKMRGVVMTLHVYAQDHGGVLDLPLQEILASEGDDKDALSYPGRGEESAMVYVRPPGKLSAIRDPARTILIYEKHDEWPEYRGLIVGFADGHVEQIESEAEFKQLLKAAE